MSEQEATLDEFIQKGDKTTEETTGTEEISEDVEVGDLQQLEESPIESWGLSKLGNILSLEYGDNLSSDNRESGSIPVYGSNGQVDTHTESAVDKPGIILGRKGSIGEIEFSNKPFWPIDTTYYITDNETDQNLRFLYYLLQNIQLERLNAASAIPGLNRNDTYGLNALIPTLEEQRKIASVLYNVDGAIQKTEEIIEQTKRIGKGIRQTLFTEGYYDHDTEISGTLGEVPSDWETTRLRKIADVSRGKFTHRPRNDPEFYGGDYPFIQTGEVVEATGELTDYTQTLNEKGKSVSKEFDPGTIIITIAGNIGDTAIATFPVYFPDSLVGITPDEEIDVYFLEHFLRYRQRFLNRLSTKTTQKNLNLSLLRPIEVVKPSLEEQQRIAEVLSAVDKQIKA